MDEVCELCGYERKYAIKVLRRQTSDNRQQRAQARRFAGYLRGRGTRGDQSDLAGGRTTLRQALKGGAEGMAAALREAQRAFGRELEAKSARQ